MSITVSHCTVDDLMSISGKDAQPVIDAINEYLQAFAKPIRCEGDGLIMGRFSCLKCGKRLTGACGTFTWGLVHGEGHCSECGWPARAYHRPTDDEGEIFVGPLDFILQYHPDALQPRPQEERV